MPQEGGIMIRTLATALATTTCLVVLATPAAAQTRDFHVPAGSLRAALDTFARQSGRQVIYRGDEVQSAKSPGVRGAHTADDALEALLAGTGFAAKKDASGAFAVVKVGNAPGTSNAASSEEGPTESVAANSESADIVVTGTHIRGAKPTSPVIDLSQDDMRNAGNTNLGDAIYQLPQNYNGGQNPAIGTGAGSQGNANSTSQLNLRGLGPDATLTLLNGRRLAYDAALQGVDITAIPLAAVDRLEIVADGSSALYGSDAVGGVANVVLRRDYNGLYTSARIGASTDGGDQQQQYSGVAGTTWSTGSIILTGNYEKSTSITARQRSYTSALDDSAILFPPITAWGGVVSGHQKISDQVVFNFDGLYNRRTTFNATPLTTTSSYSVTGSSVAARLSSYFLSPNLDIALPGRWTLNLGFTYGHDQTDQTSRSYQNSTLTLLGLSRFENTTETYEANAEGAFITLPGGDARLAVGGGYRKVIFNRASSTSASNNFDVGQNAGYGYAELRLPIVGERNAVPGIRSFDVTLAGRYEDYIGLDSIFAPKVGASYAISEDLEILSSWGKSFKAPVLSRVNAAQVALLYPASSFGSGYPAGATVIYRSGGNPDATPERATSWTIGSVLHPRRLPGAHLSISYFHIDYRDRITTPLASIGGSINNPNYADLFTIAPSAAAIANVISTAPLGLQNVTGSPYNPASVVAIYDGRYRNVARQKIHGIDISATYHFTLGSLGSLDANASGSYLISTQQIFSGQSTQSLSGIIFNPAKERGRLSLVWQLGGLTISPAANYTSKLEDNRQAAIISIPAQVTLDMTVRYKVDSAVRAFNGLELGLSAANFTNKAPPRIYIPQAYDVPYESTNYSPVGRLISVTIAKSW
jgi:iron complex outermembrane recepter protein